MGPRGFRGDVPRTIGAIDRAQITEQVDVFPFPTREELGIDPHELTGYHFTPAFQSAIQSSTLLDRSFGGADRVSLCVSEARDEYLSLRTALRASAKAGDYRVVADSGNWDDARLWEAALLPSGILEAISDILRGATP